MTDLTDDQKLRLLDEARVNLKAAVAAYPNHHPETALLNWKAGREVWDTNGDLW